MNKINLDMITRLPGEEINANIIDTVCEDDNPTMYLQEVLNSINVSGTSEHSLTLKKLCHYSIEKF